MAKAPRIEPAPAWGRQPTTSPVQLQELTLTKKAGDTVDLEVWCSGQTASVTVTLGTQP